MSTSNFEIRSETLDDIDEIEALNAAAFGPGRFAKTAYRIRERATRIDALCFTGWLNGKMIASIRFSQVKIGESSGLLLGPIIVDPSHANQGFGMSLIRRGVETARSMGHAWIILVGDAPYYEKAGFSKVTRGRIDFPGPVDPERIMVRELVSGSLESVSGLLTPD